MSVMKVEKKNTLKWEKSDIWVAVVFLLPALFFFSVYIFYPMISTIYYSLYNWSGISTHKIYVGIQNYISAFQDTIVLKSILHNFIFLAFGILIILPFSFLVALVLSKAKVKFKNGFRTTYFLPIVLNLIVIGTVWGLFFNPQKGLLNSFFNSVGLPGLSQAWLGDQSTALFALLIVSFWMRSGYYIVVYMAGIESIPDDIWDALKIDGANLFTGAIYVIIPILRSVIASTVTMALIYSINDFGMVWIMTKGGPIRATEILGTYMFTEAFSKHHAGYGSALVVIMLVISLSVAIFQMRLFEREVVEY